jgi:hypothetical protein
MTTTQYLRIERYSIILNADGSSSEPKRRVLG